MRPGRELPRGLEDVERAGGVELGRVGRLVVDLSDVGDRRQMADRSAAARCAEHVVESADVAEHGLDVRGVVPFGSAHVEDPGPVAGRGEAVDDMGADEARPAGDEHRGHVTQSSRGW